MPSQMTTPVALVTGGAKRIGSAISLALADAGYEVIIHCHQSMDEARSLADEIISRGGKAQVITEELSHIDAARALLERCQQAAGFVNVLVNNAALFLPDHIETLDQDLWQQHMTTNLALPCFLAAEFARQLPKNQKGHIINIVDQRVAKPTPLFFSYQISKSALWSATEVMAQGLAPRIRVNAIAPGPTLANQRQNHLDFKKQSMATLLGQSVAKEEIAAAVLFLLRSTSITGQLIFVDGGQHLNWQTPDIVGINE